MDVERAIQRLIDEHDRAIARMDRAEKRMERFDERLQETDQRHERRVKVFDEHFNRRNKAIQTIIDAGMKWLSRHEKQMQELRAQGRETDLRIKVLIDAQMRTDASLRLFRDSLKQPKNGRSRH